MAIATQTPYNEICIKCLYIQGRIFELILNMESLYFLTVHVWYFPFFRKGIGITLYENYRSFILLLLVIVPAFPLSTLWRQLLAYHSIDMWKTLRHSNRNKQYALILTCQLWPSYTWPADPVFCFPIMYKVDYLRVVSWSYLVTHLYGLLTGKMP
jgi:hypothetical protein